MIKIVLGGVTEFRSNLDICCMEGPETKINEKSVFRK